MHNLVLADQGWSFGGSILTFLLPMLSFAAVALALLVLYTKPETVPGRRLRGGPFPVIATRMPGTPLADGQAAANGDSEAAAAGSGKADESASAE